MKSWTHEKFNTLKDFTATASDMTAYGGVMLVYATNISKYKLLYNQQY